MYLSQSENAEAEAQFKQGLEVAKLINYPLGQAFAYNSLGRLSFAKSEYITALKFYQQALKIELKIKTNTSGYSVLRNVAAVYLAQGKSTQALEIYQESLEVYKKLNFYLDEASILNNIAGVYLDQGEYAKVLETYEQARDIYQKHNARSGEAITLLNIGSFYYIIGRYNEALNYYEKAFNTFSEIKQISGQASALSGIGLIKNQQGKLIESLDFYAQALTIYKKIDSRSGEGYTLDSIGSLKYAQQKYEDALKDFEEGLKIAKSIENPILQRSLYNHIGLVHQEQKKYAEAFESYQKALSISRDIEGDKDGEHQIIHNLGRLNLTLKQYQEAEKNLLSSIKIKESLRGGLSDINKISIIDTQLNSYSALQQVLISQNKINQALEISERARTRAFVELLAQRIAPQLEKPPSYPNLKQIKQIAIEQNATIVEYSLINNPDEEQEIYIWVIKPTGEITFRQVKLPSSGIPEKTSLTKLIQTARQLIDDNNNFKFATRRQNESSLFSPGTFIHFKDDEAGWEPSQVLSFDPQQRTITVTHPSFSDGFTIERSIDDVAERGQTTLQQLYGLLIEPIEDVLPTDEQERVIFVPDGSLFLLPFPALQNAQGNYLIEKHTIVTAPSIQVLDATRQIKQKRQPFNQSPLKPQDALIIGNPNPMPEGFSLLDNADKEALEIASLLNTKAFIGSEATETAMVKQMSQARLIHLATHGTFEDTQGLDSSIILAPTSLDNGKLTASEIFSLNLNAELVVLSACDTGRGRITGDGVIGLSRSLIAAGVESVVVSLWAVDDAATADLMVEFYRQMQQDLGKAQALRQAMLMTMKQNPSPKYWAGFTLIGEAE